MKFSFSLILFLEDLSNIVVFCPNFPLQEIQYQTERYRKLKAVKKLVTISRNSVICYHQKLQLFLFLNIHKFFSSSQDIPQSPKQLTQAANQPDFFPDFSKLSSQEHQSVICDRSSFKYRYRYRSDLDIFNESNELTKQLLHPKLKVAYIVQ
jgi:hypothetical protein